MRGKSVKSFLAVAATLLLVNAVSICAEDLVENQARIGVVTGDVGLLSSGAVEWIEAKEGLPMETGDRIRTGLDGRVEVVASEFTVWTLEPESELLMEHVKTNSGRFQLSSGTLLGVVDSAAAAGRAQVWDIVTPVATAAIRGTQFAFAFDRAKGARLGVFEGEIDLQPAETAAGVLPPTSVAAGQEAFAPKGKPIQLLKAPGPWMQGLAQRRIDVKRRQLQLKQTWTPFTPSVKQDLRKKVVAPPPKPRPRRPPAPRVRRAPRS